MRDLYGMMSILFLFLFVVFGGALAVMMFKWNGMPLTADCAAAIALASVAALATYGTSVFYRVMSDREHAEPRP